MIDAANITLHEAPKDLDATGVAVPPNIEGGFMKETSP